MKHFFFILLIIVFLPLGIIAQGLSSPFTQEIYIPPILESEGTTGGVTSYNIAVRTECVTFLGSKGQEWKASVPRCVAAIFLNMKMMV